ncbi:sigma-54-dependent transcriptional regulator [Plebeiibacterium sediminum]|uniref:Sigma-54 dependent transcriptional regulator n=1 Tax=Plebeiibacterium sediminum TaxID=2992112 RepID=A0AAE3M2T5_9BACT|nr:sigma-54 dependent transcriptional regulator [Plebeiobacterium sediminum]MCW3785750.1 sigma-54 dependent transcriptional regulator [Plebeiobacterium sediminum]
MKIHIVEDDRVFNKLIERSLALNPDFEIDTYFDGATFFKHLPDNPDVVTLDLGLPDYTGEEILKQIKKYNPDIEVIIISGQDSITTAVNLLREGAYDYITKDENIKDRLLNSVNNIRNKKKLLDEISLLKNEIATKYNFGNAIIGDSPVMKEVFALLQKAVKVPNINVSIYGDTGTGKELVAKTIHYNSIRKSKAFIAVNMGAIPRDLIESELFGHEKGAFTGAILTKKGKFEEAEGGTIFLDEIGEMDINLQVKLLRVLQEREITRVGGNEVIKVNCRIITATNKDLLEEVKAGNFREDLYYRLLGLPIHLPPLKDRQNDIITLSQFFLNQFCEDNGMDGMIFTSRAKKKLLSYGFPGNVRELKAIIELSAVMASDHKIDEENILLNSTSAELDILAEEMTLKEYTERIIRHYLRQYDNNVLKVAKKLDIGKSTIYNLIKREKQNEIKEEY